MGVGYQGLQLALYGKRRNVDYTRTVTLGRQNHFLDSNTTEEMFERFGYSVTNAQVAKMLEHEYSENIFKQLGAAQVDSMDASNYEGATVIHDLNQPIPADMHRTYTCVVDFGTLEHVFNFPTALKGSIDLLAEGGWFMSATTCNNFMGHGFYQFSPELFYNYFGKNGFVDIECFILMFRAFPYFFRITDPQNLGGRVELVNNEPVLMGVLARKRKHISEVVIPIQSDYQNKFWKGSDVNRRTGIPPVDQKIAAILPDLKARIAHLMSWQETLSPRLVNGFENSLQYQLFDPAMD